MVQTRSVDVVGTALYNYTDGYGTYLIPAVLMVVIFQTLIFIISMLSGKERETGDTEAIKIFVADPRAVSELLQCPGNPPMRCLRRISRIGNRDRNGRNDAIITLAFAIPAHRHYAALRFFRCRVSM